MNVYLLTYGNGEDGDEWAVVSIHATKESAEAAKAEYEKPMLHKDGFPCVHRCNAIEEWAVKQ